MRLTTIARRVLDLFGPDVRSWVEYHSGHHTFFYPWGTAMNGQTARLEIVRSLVHSIRPVQIVDPVYGRESMTQWRVLTREVDRTRVRLEPMTGRTHQLRVHMASGLGRPIIGDSLYGGEPAERLMLHAAELSFLEPGTRRRVEFASRPPF